MKSITSEKIIDTLENMFVQHGIPKSITSDNGTQFVSNEFETYLKENGIRHRRVTPLHPAANGEVERQNRSLMKRIRIAQAEGKDWKKELRVYLFAYRTTPHSVTGVTPAEMMWNRKLRTKLPELDDNTIMDEEISDRDAVSKLKNKLYIDEKRGAKESDVCKGDKVLVKVTQRDKMSTPYHTEPYVVIEKKGNSVVVESPQGVRYKRNSTHVRSYNERVNEANVNTPNDNLKQIDTSIVNGNSKIDNTEQNKPVDTEQSDKITKSNENMIVKSRPVREKRKPKRFDDF
ncbi:uncharacterized protein [Antedon mediterranea]|uniref:uncharacterized protein n=1 Tax=Antedon mediterranea TaxID=105859 RepID=UPI003AF7BA42